MNFTKGEILSFNKPYGWTSFQVVSKVRSAVSKKLRVKKIKVGHAGTLDPLATGVLIVCTGKATKLIDELQAHTKEYVATLKLGATTPSFDKETDEDSVYPTEHISKELVETVLQKFVGTIEQTPPEYSAVKINGKRAYEFARKGKSVELKPKTLTIDRIELLEYRFPEIVISVVCSKGTYIRALARDIGRELQSGAYLTGLIRTRIGDYKIDECLNPETFNEWLDSQEIEYEEPQNGN